MAAKLNSSIDVPLPPEEAWAHASDLRRFDEWLSVHTAWRSALPETLEKGTVIDSIVCVKGMYNRVKWTLQKYDPPTGLFLDGQGRGGVKVKLRVTISPKGSGSVVDFNLHLGGPAMFGPIGALVAAALRSDIDASLAKFVQVFAATP